MDYFVFGGFKSIIHYATFMIKQGAGRIFKKLFKTLQNLECCKMVEDGLRWLKCPQARQKAGKLYASGLGPAAPKDSEFPRFHGGNLSCNMSEVSPTLRQCGPPVVPKEQKLSANLRRPGQFACLTLRNRLQSCPQQTSVFLKHAK